MVGLSLAILKIHEWRTSKKNLKRLEKQNTDVKKRVSELEINLEAVQNKLSKEKKDGWTNCWEKAKKAKLELYSLEDELKIPYVNGKSGEKLLVYERLSKKVAELSDLIKPAESLFDEIDKKELCALCDYIFIVNPVYRRLKKDGISPSNELQKFEKKYRGTKTADKVNELLSYHFSPEGPETKIFAYLNFVYSKTNSSVPSLFDMGIEGEPSNWKTSFDEKSRTVKGVYKKHWFSKPSLVFTCQYFEEFPDTKEILKKAKKAQDKKQYRIECIVMDEIPKDMASTINNFSNSRMALYGFELNIKGGGKENPLYNNTIRECVKFSRYFNPNSKQRKNNFPT